MTHLVSLMVFATVLFGNEQALAKNDFNSAYGGPTASDQVSQIYIPKFKIQYGADGSVTDVSTVNPFPVAVVSTVPPIANYALESGGHLQAIDLTLSTQLDVLLSTRASESTLSLFKTANHTDLTLLDADLNSFKSANHIDLLGVQTGLVGVQTGLVGVQTRLDTVNSNLVTVQGKQDTGNASLSSIDSKLTPPLLVAQSGVWTTGRTWTLGFATDSVTSRLYDGAGNPITSQASGSQRALDIGITVGGTQVDPRTRTWTLGSGTDSVGSVQSGAWTTGRTWSLLNSTDSVNAVQSGTWTVQQGTPPWSVSQSGAWTTGRTWTLASGTDTTTVVQPTGSNLHVQTDSGSTTAVTQATASNLNAQVVGNAASSATDIGNPIKIGTIFNTTQPTVANGQRVDAQGTSRGAVIVNPGVETFNVQANAGTNLNTSALSTESTLSTLSGKVANNYGSSAGAVRTAGQIGNATGAADFNYGAASAQTLRVAALLGNATGIADFNYGTVGAQTQRVASEIGNATGAADFGYGTANAQTLRVLSIPTDGTRDTYSASTTIAIALLPTDIFTITGSGTKTIKVTKVEFTGTTSAGSGIIATVQLIKRSAANTGGTSTAVTAVPHDSSFAAATASVLAYTANPSALGTAVGTMRSDRVAFESSSVTSEDVVWDFGNRPSKAVVLRGTSQLLAINFSATTITGGSISINLEWVEE